MGAKAAAFAPISSAGPIARTKDIAAGWDGSLWAIDEVFGPSIDAACSFTGRLRYFRGAEVLILILNRTCSLRRCACGALSWIRSSAS